MIFIIFCKTEYEMKLCTKDEHVTTKMYTTLLKFETEQQSKECMIKWALEKYVAKRTEIYILLQS